MQENNNNTSPDFEIQQVSVDDGDDIVAQDIVGEKADIQPKPFYKMPKFIIGVVIVVAVLAAITPLPVQVPIPTTAKKQPQIRVLPMLSRTMTAKMP